MGGGTMSMGSMVGRGFVMVSPSMRGFKAAVAGEMQGAATAGEKTFSRGFAGVGDRLGGRVGKGFKSAFRSGAVGVSDGVLKALNADVAKATQALSQARLKQQDTAGRVRVAEARLAEAVAKNGAGSARAVAAEEALAAARRRDQTATDAVTQASIRLASAQGRVKDATEAAASGGGSMRDRLGAAFQQVGESASNAGKRVADSIGRGIQAASQVAAAALAAVGTQLVAIGKGSISAFANYEQAVGGIDTLFGEASGKVQEFAKDAFKTAGVSANDYMSQVTSFSASLISSLGGDTDAAAELANQAMIDMSDNANKMGTDLTTVQQTYQSLARGNFAMLDNLKLGYGGTKAEMERLLADAEKLSGKKYSIGNFADMVDAIHVVQGELGITGTTALEAEKTISGSVGAMKASWSNWLTELAKTDGDVTAVTEHLVDSVMTVLQNIVPRVKQLIKGLIQSIPTMLSGVGDLLPPSLSSMFDGLAGSADKLTQVVMPLGAAFAALGVGGILPLLSRLPIIGGMVGGLATKFAFLSNPLVLAGAALAAFMATGGDFGALADWITGMIDGLVQALPGVIDQIVKFIPELVDGLLAGLTGLIEAGTGIVAALIDGIVQALPLLVEGSIKLINGLVMGIVQNLPMLIQAALGLVNGLLAGIIQALPLLLQGAINIIIGITQGIVQALPLLVQAAVQLITGLITGLVQAIPMLIDAALQMMEMLITALIDALPLIIDAGIQLVIGLVKGLIESLPQLIDAAVQLVMGIFQALVDNLPTLIEAGIQLVVALAGGLIEALPELVGAIPELVGGIIDAFMQVDWLSLGADIIGGIVQGIGNMAGAFIEAIINLAGEAWNEVLSFFGIASPSKLMRDTVGKQIPAGLAVGVEQGTDVAVDAARRMSEATADAAQTTAVAAVDARGTSGGAVGVAGAGVVLQQTIHAAPGMSERAVADIAAGRLEYDLGGVS